MILSTVDSVTPEASLYSIDAVMMQLKWDFLMASRTVVGYVVALSNADWI